jgi:ABC-2 type transport system permease protein
MTDTASTVPTFATAPLARMFVEHVRAQFLAFLRNVALSVVTLVMPIVLFAFIATAGAGRAYGGGSTFGAYFLASMAAYAVSAVMIFNFGVTVAVDRGQRVDRLIRVAPVPPVIYLAARVTTALIFALVALAALFAYAALVAGVTLEPSAWFLLAGALLSGAFPFIALGFAIAYLVGPNAAVAVANITYLVLAFASGIFMPFDSLPALIQSVAVYLPTYHYAQLAWGMVGITVESPFISFAWLAAYGIALFAIAAWAYRREEIRTYG